MKFPLKSQIFRRIKKFGAKRTAYNLKKKLAPRSGPKVSLDREEACRLLQNVLGACFASEIDMVVVSSMRTNKLASLAERAKVRFIHYHFISFQKICLFLRYNESSKSYCGML